MTASSTELISAAHTASKGLDLTRPADIQLAAFDRDHPQCRLWTNWEKMCSRTGPNGETRCTEDPDRVVEPSEPFCVAQEGVAIADRAFTGDQRASAGRFCRRRATFVSRMGPNGWERRPDDSCLDQDPNRPFNGRQIAARLHPWCGAWNDVRTHRRLCSTHPARGERDCAQLTHQAHANSSGLYCSHWQLPSWCLRAESGAHGPPPPGPNGIVIGNAGIEEMEVLGIYCAEERR
jgi:hypothetical protein